MTHAIRSFFFFLISIVGAIAQDGIVTGIYSPFSPGSILHTTGTNPTLSAIAAPPTTALQTLLPASGSMTLYNNALIIPAPSSLLFLKNNPGSWIASLLNESFDLYGLSPSQVSSKLSDAFKNGISIRTALSLPYLRFATIDDRFCPALGWGVSLSSTIGGFVYIPGGLFSLIFSTNNGLQPGNTISFRDLTADIEICTDLHLSYGRIHPDEFSVRFLPTFKAAWGIDLSYRMGHVLFLLETKKGTIVYSKDNVLSIHGASTITTAGMGLHDNYQFTDPFSDGIPINGHGIGVSGGVLLFSDHASLSCYIKDFGVTLWKSGLLQSEITIQDDSLYLIDLLDNNQNNQFDDSAFRKKGRRSIPYETLLNLEYSYIWNLKRKYNPTLSTLSSYRLVCAGYRQPLVSRFDKTRSPCFSFVFENGFFRGTYPCRIGWTLGKRENLSSFVELEQVCRGLTYSLRYRAINDAFFRSSRGIEMGVTTHFFLDW